MCQWENYIFSAAAHVCLSILFISVCAKGYFLDDKTCDCKLCPIGTYSDTEDADVCTSCPPGKTTFQKGSDRISLCQPGKELEILRIELSQAQLA